MQDVYLEDIFLTHDLMKSATLFQFLPKIMCNCWFLVLDLALSLVLFKILLQLLFELQLAARDANEFQLQ